MLTDRREESEPNQNTADATGTWSRIGVKPSCTYYSRILIIMLNLRLDFLSAVRNLHWPSRFYFRSKSI